MFGATDFDRPDPDQHPPTCDGPPGSPAGDPLVARALRWLLRGQRPDGAWGDGAADTRVYATALAAHALLVAEHRLDHRPPGLHLPRAWWWLVNAPTGVSGRSAAARAAVLTQLAAADETPGGRYLGPRHGRITATKASWALAEDDDPEAGYWRAKALSRLPSSTVVHLGRIEDEGEWPRRQRWWEIDAWRCLQVAETWRDPRSASLIRDLLAARQTPNGPFAGSWADPARDRVAATALAILALFAAAGEPPP